MRRLAALLLVVLAACGGSSGAPAVTTLASVEATTTSTSSTVPATTTTVAFSREARLAVGHCQDAVPPNFPTAVALDSIGRDASADLSSAQTVCTEAERQLKADNGPDGSRIAKMLEVTEKLNDALLVAEQRLPGGNFINDDCPDKPTCPVTVLQKAVDAFAVGVMSWVG